MSQNRPPRTRRPKLLPAEHHEPLTVDETYYLADNLLCALTPLAGDPIQVNNLMRRWFDTYGNRFGAIAMAAVRTTFVDCLHPTDSPTGAFGFAIKEKTP